MAGGNGADVNNGGGGGGTFDSAGSIGNSDDGGRIFGGGGGGGGAGAAGGDGGSDAGSGGAAGASGTLGAPLSAAGTPATAPMRGANGAGTQGSGGGGGGGNGILDAVGGTVTLATSTTGGTGGAGGNGLDGRGGKGGGGGSGGYGYAVTIQASVTSGIDLTGGTGGAGGNSANFAGSANGGDGGGGIYLGAAASSLNVTSGVIAGGTGGASGTGGGGGVRGAGGRGGAGGDGVDMFLGGNISNAGTIQGGTGGSGEVASGSGGRGIVGADLTITNSGTITAGLSTLGVQADAIVFAGGFNNRLTLSATSGSVTTTGTITGNIAIGGVTFLDPGTVAGVGVTLANLITNYVEANGTTHTAALVKDGVGTLTLTGANTYSSGTLLSAGTLDLSAATTGTFGAITSGAAGRGSIGLGTGAQTLRVETVAVDAATHELAYAITNFAADGDTIDLRGIGTATLAVYNATNGTLTVSGGTQTETLHVNAAPSGYQFTLSADGVDGTNVTLTAIPALPAPSGPTAVSDTDSTTLGTVATKAAPGVLANDSGAGGTLSVTAVNGQSANVGKAVAGTYGTLTLAADGSYSYTPDPAKAVFTGSVVDHFTYTDTANGQTASAALDITVAPPSAATLALFGTVVTSPANQTGSIYGLYEGLLHRAPDALGLEGFTTALQTGASLTDVAGAILSSAERGGAVTDPTAYVQSLYANALHRQADGGGLSFYTNELARGVSQATVAVQIATSAEAQSVNAPAFSTGVFVPDAIDSAVARLYYGVLGRAPDANGLASFEGQVKQAAASSGYAGALQGLGSSANAMLGSPEYTAAHAGQTNAAFVDSLYVGALGRHVDTAGASYFAGELAQGVSQAVVALQIAESAEAQVHLVGQIEQGFHLVA